MQPSKKTSAPGGGAVRPPEILLFVCRDRAVFAPIAAGLARQMLGAAVKIRTAATAPAEPDALTLQVMSEINIDVADLEPSEPPLTVGAETLVILLGEKRHLPPLPAGQRHVHWPIVDPREPPVTARQELLARFRDVRTAIGKHLKQLLHQHAIKR